MTALRAMWEAVCLAGLAAAAVALFLTALLLTPYFAWRWWREERDRKADMQRWMIRRGYWDHPPHGRVK